MGIVKFCARLDVVVKFVEPELKIVAVGVRLKLDGDGTNEPIDTPDNELLPKPVNELFPKPVEIGNPAPEKSKQNFRTSQK